MSSEGSIKNKKQKNQTKNFEPGAGEMAQRVKTHAVQI